MCSRTESRILRASSGSRSARNSIDPLSSAKSTVTCLRSPSSARRDVRIFSARWRGVYVSGEAKRVDGAEAVVAVAVPGLAPALPPAPVGRPHSLQNFAVGPSCVPQPAQTDASRVPHSEQNFVPTADSCAQCGQTTVDIGALENLYVRTPDSDAHCITSTEPFHPTASPNEVRHEPPEMVRPPA